MRELINKFINKKTVFLAVCILVALHPVIELDYLLYNVLDKFGLPRLTTIIDLLVLPGLVLLTFLLFEKNKKRVVLLFGIYVIVFGVYFVFHCQNADLRIRSSRDSPAVPEYQM